MATGQQIADTAYAARGTPHAWGGTHPTVGLDGGGLVRYAYGSHGIDLPGQVWNLVTLGDSVPPSKLQPGDLIYLSADAGGKQADQVGIYTQKGKFVHSPGPGQQVQVSSLADGYYMDRMTDARRIPGVATAFPQTVRG